MDKSEALEHVTEISVSASETVQIEQYEPSKSHVSYTAAVPEDVNPVVLENQLQKAAQESAQRMMMRRVEQQIREEDDD